MTRRAAVQPAVAPALPAPAPGAVVVSKSAEVEGSAGLPSKIPTGITVLHAVYNRSHAVIRVIVVIFFTTCVQYCLHSAHFCCAESSLRRR